MNTHDITPTGQQNMVKPSMSMLGLNDDCLLKINRMLPLSDLTKLSGVCQDFQHLAGEAFYYEWKNRTIRLSSKSKDERLESMAILRNFGTNLRKVQIVFDKYGNDTFFNAFIDKCSDEITEVEFSSTYFNFNQDRILNRDNIRRLNAKFKNLKALRFDSTTEGIVEPECIEQHFPALEELSLPGYAFEGREVGQFVKLNPQVKRLFSFHFNHIRDAIATVEMFDQQLPQLEQLGLCLHGQPGVTQSRPRFLRNLKSLTIRNMGLTANWQYLSIATDNLEEMDLELGNCDESSIDLICKCKKLAKLAIRVSGDSLFDFKWISKLKEQLPMLIEVEIDIQGSKLMNVVFRRNRKKSTMQNTDTDKILLETAVLRMMF